jgi:hypothetical protein
MGEPLLSQRVGSSIPGVDAARSGTGDLHGEAATAIRARCQSSEVHQGATGDPSHRATSPGDAQFAGSFSATRQADARLTLQLAGRMISTKHQYLAQNPLYLEPAFRPTSNGESRGQEGRVEALTQRQR